MKKKHIAILHYSAPPVIGGVEAVIQAQAKVLLKNGYAVHVIAGRGDSSALPDSCAGTFLPLIDSQQEDILQASQTLEQGHLPHNFESLVQQIKNLLIPVLKEIDHLIVHNIFSKHFNLPLTAALTQLIQEGKAPPVIAWTHDLTWTSPNSRSKVHQGYPWDLLRQFHQGITYVTVSEKRQEELCGLLKISPERVHIVHNGVEPYSLLGISPTGEELSEKLGLLDSDLNILMPVRVTQAKNIEYALQVLKALQDKYQNPRLVVTGPPDPHSSSNIAYFQSLKDQRHALGLEKQMRFIYECGPDPEQPFTISDQVVGDLFRISDVMFMPSHREGFGMPVLEAGFAGIPVMCSPVPAAVEIGKADIVQFDPAQPPQKTADTLSRLIEDNPLSRFRRRVRLNYTWQALFTQKIVPLLKEDA
ncbi:MAG: glycosyltransferase family 4 protein [Anaerolineaceae bacterium]|jgi:glycosyltransferase involved in cell wall biosynthesis|nr:glycosyltransferase family 4 protein [Anaerolineaceae bacterium]